MIAPNTWRISAIGNDGFNSLVVLTFHYLGQLGNLVNTAGSVADAFQAAFEANAPTQVVSGVNFDKIVVRDEGDITVGLEQAITVIGSRAGQAMPPQIAGQVEKLTGLIGRANRGRNYWPGPSEDDNDGGAPDDAYKSDLVAVMNSLKSIDDGSGNLYDMIVYSKTHDHVNFVQDFVAVTNWGTLTRRKPGRGQ